MGKGNLSFRDIAGWFVFLVGFVVFFMTAERAGSLWDCGEFVSAAYKLQVVHPPGAPLYILVGRIFAILGDLFSSQPEGVAFGVNMLSGISTAFAGMFVCWSTYRLVHNFWDIENEEKNKEFLSIAAGVVAGLCSMFVSSVWFSAVEGEVYALSMFFLALTLWTTVKWYTLPSEPKNVAWLILSMFAIGLSLGVHLLSLLVFPIVAILFYYKYYDKDSIFGVGVVAAIGAIMIGLIQKFIITGIPSLWKTFEIPFVNGLGLPFHSGLIGALLVLGALVFFGLRYAHQRNLGGLQAFIIGASMLIVGYSTIGVVVVRAAAEPPINMSDPYDVTRLLPYLNREQYGERPILRGPQFTANPISTESEDRYGRVEDGYEVVDRKLSYVYADRDKVMFPRMSSPQGKDEGIYKQVWMSNPEGNPTSADNFKFFIQYQLGWMYWRYFAWNFIGRQNFDQGFFASDKASGNWLSGIGFWDQARLYNMSLEPDERKKSKARNKYFAIPFILGLIGLFYHFKKKRRDALALLGFFVITGVGLIVYSNQPPVEPRERDYVLVGSFMTFCIWIGIAIPAIWEFLSTKISGPTTGFLSVGLAAIAPILLVTQNWDDHSRCHLRGASDFGANYLRGAPENAILFTFGDNDTYPVWYAQEVENVRLDVRPINMSLIGIDYYIQNQRRKVNEAERVDFITPAGTYRGNKRNFISVENGPAMSLKQVMKYVGEQHKKALPNGSQALSSFPTKNVYLEVDKAYWLEVLNDPELTENDLPGRLDLSISGNYIYKGDLAVLDILAANFNKRPICYAATAGDKTFGLNKYMRAEGIVNHLVPLQKRSSRVLREMVDEEKNYDLIMNSFEWGNFDKYEMYVDDKFAPVFGAHSILFQRTVGQFYENYLNSQDALNAENRKAEPNPELVSASESDMQRYEERILALYKKYYEVFPVRNFGYPLRPNMALYFSNILSQLRKEDEVRELMLPYAEHVKSYLDFYSAMDPNTRNASQTFGIEYRDYSAVPQQLISYANRFSDEGALAGEVQEILASHIDTPETN